MKKITTCLSIWLFLCVGIYVGLMWSKPIIVPVVEEFIGWEVTYSGPISPEGETFITEFIPSYKHMPSAGYLHFACKNGEVNTYLLWSRVIKVQEVYGSTSILSDRELECVAGKESLKISEIKIT